MKSFTPSPSSARADPAAVFQFPTVRFSLLTPRLVRIEASPQGRFEDRPSQVFWYRRQPLPQAECRSDDKGLSIETEAFHLTYRDSTRGLTRGSLEVVVRSTGSAFHLDDPNPGQFPGTTRTLDETSGPITLQPGLVSRSGWVQLDDTPSLVFDPSGWLEPRPVQPGYRDLYLLVGGQDHKAALRDYQLVAGTPPLLPRAFLGNWWSRYWEYSQEEIRQLVGRFRQERIPLSVLIIDMDWHITRTGNACSGWTGFSWNRSLFPDPPGLLNWLHENGLIASLNLHPAEGIYPHEERYPQAARALELDPEKQEPIPFAIDDPRFARVYFDQLLHPLEAQGVDFWWIDWQQGEYTSLPGLDPLWWLNHLHFYDLARDGKKRPVIFSRWGGYGNHRYPIGFSGDTIIGWRSLAYQPYFTAAAANAAYGWWSHDIGGHMRGMEDPELYTRWVQFGVLSPIYRLHSTKDRFIDHQPWAFDAETLQLTREAMQFRQALVPYLYTMAQRNTQAGLPLITPLYYDWPGEESAAVTGGQYLLGSELMAAPVTSPLDPDLDQSRCLVWFPPGEWFDFHTGERHTGPQWEIQYHALADIPLFARAGAILPLQADTTRNGVENPRAIDLVVFPGKDGEFRLYEDDGVTQEYLHNGGCTTLFRSSWAGRSLSVQILPAAGDTGSIPRERIYRLLLRGIDRPQGAAAALDGEKLELSTAYDPATRTCSLGPVTVRFDQELRVEIHTADPTLLAQPIPLETRLLRLLRRAKMETVTKGKISTLFKDNEDKPSALADPDLNLTPAHLLGLLETITGTGAARIDLPEGGSRILAVNPRQMAGFICRGKTPLTVEARGTLFPEDTGIVQVDYFGLIQKTL